jgi:hypothetical protein
LASGEQAAILPMLQQLLRRQTLNLPADENRQLLTEGVGNDAPRHRRAEGAQKALAQTCARTTQWLGIKRLSSATRFKPV